MHTHRDYIIASVPFFPLSTLYPDSKDTRRWKSQVSTAVTAALRGSIECANISSRLNVKRINEIIARKASLVAANGRRRRSHRPSEAVVGAKDEYNDTRDFHVTIGYQTTVTSHDPPRQTGPRRNFRHEDGMSDAQLCTPSSLTLFVQGPPSRPSASAGRPGPATNTRTPARLLPYQSGACLAPEAGNFHLGGKRVVVRAESELLPRTTSATRYCVRLPFLSATSGRANQRQGPRQRRFVTEPHPSPLPPSLSHRRPVA